MCYIYISYISKWENRIITFNLNSDGNNIWKLMSDGALFQDTIWFH